MYLDTSVIAPIYWAEALSETVEQLLESVTEVTVSNLVEVELCSALSRRVRMREIIPEHATEILTRFQSDLSNGFYNRVALEQNHYNLAREWICRFETTLRTLDALNLAVAFSNGLCMVTADEGLALSAETLSCEYRILRPNAEG